LQFLESVESPSSHVSQESTTLPSPHFGIQTAAVVVEPAVQEYSGLIPLQPIAHPSPSSSPSSQVSVPYFLPSAQSSMQKIPKSLNPGLHKVQLLPVAQVLTS